MNALSFHVVDWNRSRRAELEDVPPTTTVAEILSEVREAMRLSSETPYSLIYGSEKLNRSSTLEEVGIERGEEVTVAPEVSAG